MPIAWHPKGYWNVYMSWDKKKEIEPIFTEECFNVYNLRVLKHFDMYLEITKTFEHIKICANSKFSNIPYTTNISRPKCFNFFVGGARFKTEDG